MATWMAASSVAFATGSNLVCVRAAKLSRQSASPRGLVIIRCNNANLVEGEQQLRVESNKNGAPLRLSAVVVPMLAAAFVGSVQPAVQASEWDKLVVPVEYEASSSSADEPYKDLWEKIKDKRAAREKGTPSVQAEEKKSDAGASTYSSPFFSPAPVYTPPAPPTPPPVAKTPELAAAPAVAKPTPVESLPTVVAAEKEKTHGFLPLFLTQFLLLVATVGGGYVLITTPDSKWQEVQKTVDGYVSKATPFVEDSWTKAKPVAIQAGQKVSEFTETAKPYVVKAWEASKPLAAKAVEASKPILKSAQTKAVELFEQATSNKQ